MSPPLLWSVYLFNPQSPNSVFSDHILQKCATVDIDTNLVINHDLKGVRKEVLEHLDAVAKWTGTDVFLLNPKSQDPAAVTTSYGNGSDFQFDQRLRIAIYGDPESSEHAKTRVLIMIDQTVRHSHYSLAKARKELLTLRIA